jgi:hypothetical protein
MTHSGFLIQPIAVVDQELPISAPVKIAHH